MTAVANDTEVSMTDSTPLLEIGVQVEAVTEVGCMRGVYLGRYEATVLLALTDNRVHDVPEGSVLTVLADADPATMPLVCALRDEAVLRRRMRDDTRRGRTGSSSSRTTRPTSAAGAPSSTICWAALTCRAGSASSTSR